MEHTNRSEPGTERADQGTQLRLLPGGPARDEWVLDSRTRAVGREGVARARQILATGPPARTARSLLQGELKQAAGGGGRRDDPGGDVGLECLDLRRDPGVGAELLQQGVRHL